MSLREDFGFRQRIADEVESLEAAVNVGARNTQAMIMEPQGSGPLGIVINISCLTGSGLGEGLLPQPPGKSEVPARPLV